MFLIPKVKKEIIKNKTGSYSLYKGYKNKIAIFGKFTRSKDFKYYAVKHGSFKTKIFKTKKGLFSFLKKI